MVGQVLHDDARVGRIDLRCSASPSAGWSPASPPAWCGGTRCATSALSRQPCGTHRTSTSPARFEPGCPRPPRALPPARRAAAARPPPSRRRRTRSGSASPFHHVVTTRLLAIPPSGRRQPSPTARSSRRGVPRNTSAPPANATQRPAAPSSLFDGVGLAELGELAVRVVDERHTARRVMPADEHARASVNRAPSSCRSSASELPPAARLWQYSPPDPLQRPRWRGRAIEQRSSSDSS